MSATSYAASTPFSQRKHNAVITGVMVVVFWIVAAVLVTMIQRTIVTASPLSLIALKTAAIILAAFGYVQLTARHASLDHALLVGTAWLLLAMASELAATAHWTRHWFDLLGAPDSGLRNVMILAWMAAPALFAQRRT
jgi:hypothetical protein